MDDAISRGVLRGRPFGGTGILIRKSLATKTKLLCKSSRFIAVMVDQVIVCCVYMPCTSVPLRDEVFMDTIACISNLLEEHCYAGVIIGGDFNLCFTANNPSMTLLRDFCAKFELQFIDSLLPDGDTYTFRLLHGNSSSLIDHFVVSNDISLSSMSLEVLDSGVNLSDHCALRLVVLLSSECISVDDDFIRCNGPRVQGDLSNKLRWDKANLSEYYAATYTELVNTTTPDSFRGNSDH